MKSEKKYKPVLLMTNYLESPKASVTIAAVNATVTDSIMNMIVYVLITKFYLSVFPASFGIQFRPEPSASAAAFA
jgi:hypothetical protein